MSKSHSSKKIKSKPNRFLSVIGIFLCIVFGVVLACNLTIIIKSNISPDEPPSVLGITPFTVVSGSMSGDREGHLEVGDLLLVQKVEAAELKEGDVISFIAGGSVTTHRIVKISKVSGQLQFTTKGDANNSNDQAPVTEEQLVGRYLLRIPKIGEFALFLREPMGMVLFVVVPLVLFLFADVLARRRKEEREDERKSEPSALELEVAQLRAMLEEYKSAPPSAPAPQPAPVLPPVVTPPSEEPKLEDSGGFYVGEPPKADEALLSAIYDGTPPPVMEPPKPQEPEEVSLEEILAFAKKLEMSR